MSTLIDYFAPHKSTPPIKEQECSQKRHSFRKSVSASASMDLLSNLNNGPCCNGHNKTIGSASLKNDSVNNKIPQNDLGIRLLIFIEDANGVRSNIFDSGTYQHRNQNPNQNLTNGSVPTSSPSHSHNRHISSKTRAGSSSSLNKQNKTTLNNEMIKLTHMVFGSFPMIVSNRTAIKVHSLKNSNKTMISSVFVYYNNNKAQYKNNHKHGSNGNQIDCRCDDSFKHQRQRGESFSHTSSSSFNSMLNNTQLLESPSEYSKKRPAENEINKSPTTSATNNILEASIILPKTNSKNQNTKPIDIILSPKMNNSLNGHSCHNHESLKRSNQSTHTNQKLSASLTNTKSIHINSNQCSIHASEISRETKSEKVVIDMPHQSSSSSLISSNSSSNLNLNNEHSQNIKEDSFNSPCSSVPTYYGSYTGIYKRLMRSVSTSLISSTATTIPNISNMNESGNSGRINLDNSDFSNSLNNEGRLDGHNHKHRKISTTNSSFSIKESDTVNQPWICEKCIDSNRYPKYKVGMAVLFCLPNPRKNDCSSNSTPSTSPLSTSFSPSNADILSDAQRRKPSKNQQSYDPIVMFPSSPPLPSSPKLIEEYNQDNQEPTSELENNENFYQFFFSHLPIIEHQIKELKEKLIDNLPFYFNQSSKVINRNSFSVFSQSNPKCANCLPKKMTPNLTQKLVMATNSFSQRMLYDLDEYERRFNLLYTSPRLNKPAWLTIINNRKIANTLPQSINLNNQKSLSTMEIRLNKSQIATFNLCNNLINEFSYFHKIKKSHNTPQIIQNTQSNGNRFLNSLRNTLSKEKSISSSQNGLTENTSYSFLSILMSTILKHHLSWVYTILPSNERSKSTTTNSALRKQRAHWTSILEKTNPYNPLWAQLGDLHGAVNHPLRLVRTVVIGKNKEIVERLLVLLSYFIRCGNSSYYDISAENFDFGMLSNKALSKDISSPSSSMPSSQSQATNVSESLKKFKYQSSFDEDEKMDMTSIENHLEDMNTLSLDSKNLSREVNIFDLNIDPLSQFTAVLGIYSAAKNGSEGGSNSKNFQKSSRQNRQLNSDELNYMSSLSSSSSITSPSSCSMSSSPLSLNLKNLKKNSSTILEVNTKQHPLMIDSSSTTLTHKERLSPGTKKPRVSNNSFSNSYGENNCTAQELPLIGCKLKPNYQKSTRMQDNFGYSLLASYCDEFVFEFVLQGTSDRSFLSNLHERLVFSKMNSIIDCPIQEAVYIVVDVDELDVKVYSSEHACMPVKEKPVHLVDSMLTSVLNMIKLFKSSEFVLLHLEDKLQEFYNKAITLNQLKSQSSSIGNDMLIQLMELNDDADLDFLNRILQAVDIPEIF